MCITDKEVGMKILAKLLLAAGILGSMPAMAVTYVENWGQHGMIEGAGRLITNPGVFEDIFTFSLSAPTSLTSVAVSHNHAPFLNLLDGTVLLYQGVHGDASPDTTIGSVGFGGTTGDSEHSWGPLAAGNYFYVVTANAMGTLGGLYTFTSAVPEAETWAMMAMGLGLVGLQLRRRKNAEKIA